MGQAHMTTGRLCEDAIRAFDRLCEVESRRAPGKTGPTPRQRHRRQLLEARARATAWRIPDPLAETVVGLIAAADRIDDPVLAGLWTDHLPVAVLACLERRSLTRRIADGDPLVVGP